MDNNYCCPTNVVIQTILGILPDGDAPPTEFILQEDGSYILLGGGGRLGLA